MIFFISFLPESFLKRFVYLLSPILRIVDRRHWKTGIENIEMALREEKRTAEKLLIKVYTNLLLNIKELVWFLIAPNSMLKKVKFKNPEMGRGQRIFFSAHLSNWELMTFAHSIIQKQRLAIVGKKLKNPYFNYLLLKLREKGKIKVVYINESRRIIKLLKSGYSIGFLIDQFPVEKASSNVKFFGIETQCITAPARLSELYGVPMQGGFIKREKGGYIIEYSEPIPVHFTVNEKMQKATSIVEEEIRKRPEEWLWLHRRWR